MLSPAHMLSHISWKTHEIWGKIGRVDMIIFMIILGEYQVLQGEKGRKWCPTRWADFLMLEANKTGTDLPFDLRYPHHVTLQLGKS